MAPDSNELLAYRVEQLEGAIKSLSTEVAVVHDYITKQGAARAALIGAAGILGGAVSFLASILFGLFHR